MNEFTALLARTGVSLPRGVLGAEAHALANAIRAEAPEVSLEELRVAASRAHWEQLRLAIGAALERQGDGSPEATRALELTFDDDPRNPFALALADDAGRSLAGVLERNAERLAVLEARLAEGASGDGELALVVGAIVVDLLDLDPEDYEDEIAAYVGAGETDAAQRELARSTGDDESRAWAREELGSVEAADAASAERAVRMLSAGEPPEDPADDPVWVATVLALVEQAVEVAVVMDSDEETE